jgi:hypothetical protein
LTFANRQPATLEANVKSKATLNQIIASVPSILTFA